MFYRSDKTPAGKYPYRSLPSVTFRWFLCCLIMVLMLGYWVIQPALTYANTPLVTQEIRYHLPEAGEVYLVWGTNGWAVVPEEIRPAGTILEDGVMQTPMVAEGDGIFVVQIEVPAGATIDYGFLITKKHGGAAIKAVWDGNYNRTVTQNNSIEVKTELTLAQEQVPTSLSISSFVTQEIRYYLPKAGEVFLVWGINDWSVVPESIRPTGTILKDGVMYTPMTLEGDTFVAKVQVATGTSINYLFQITKTRNGVTTDIWDTKSGSKEEYHTIAKPESVAEVQAPPLIVQQVANSDLSIKLSWPDILWLIGICVVLIIVAASLLKRDEGRLSRKTPLALLQSAVSVQAELLILWGMAILSLLFRLYAVGEWNVGHIDGPGRLWGDEVGYNSLALGLLKGLFFDWPGRVPLYPLWLAGVHLLTKQSYSGILYVQTLLGVSVIPLTYLLGRRIFGRSPALIAAFLAAINFPLIYQSVYFLSEILYTPIILLVTITLWDAMQKPTMKRFCWAGFWVGVSALVRPTLLLFPFFSIVMYLIIFNRRQAMRYWIIYVLGALLVVTPWIGRNYVHFHALFPLATNNGFFWLGSPEYYHLVRDEGYSYAEIWPKVLYASDRPEFRPDSIEGDRYWTKRALRSIAREPLVYIKYAIEKIGYYWVGHPDIDWGGTYPFSYDLLRSWGYTPQGAALMMFARAIPILALLASIFLYARWRMLLPIYIICIYCTLLHAAAHAEARLSDPLQPLLMILVGGAVVMLGQKVIMVMRGNLPISSSYARITSSHRMIYLRDLVRELVARDLKLRYKRSILGIAWSLLNPLAQLLIFVFLFHKVFPLNIPNYPLFVFSGVLAWTWFQSSLFLATGAITDNRELIRRPGFPAAILPVVTVMSSLIHFLLALPVLLLFVLIAGIHLTSAILMLLVVIALQFLLTLSLAYFVATFHVTFRDTQHLLGVLLLLLFYLTPVFYTASAVPERYQWLYFLNPMAHLIGAYRTILIQGELPGYLMLLSLGVVSAGLFGLGYTVFMRASYRFVEEL